MKVQILIPFIIYLILLIIIGIFTTRSVSTGMPGFFLGDRKINRFIIAISTVVSARGSWLLLGVTTQAYIMGISSVWLVAGFILSELLLFLFLAPAVRKYSEEHNCLTLTDIFTSRYKNEKKTLGIVVSLALLFFSMSFISSQLLAGGKAFYAFFGLAPANGIIITGVITLLFTLTGGFKTLSYSDVFQACIILAVLLFLPILILLRREGLENLQNEIILGSPDFFDLKALSFGTLLGFLSIGLGSAGSPGILVKYMSINNPKHFPRLAVVNVLINILMGAGAICTGMFARVYFPAPESIPGADAQNVYFGLAGMVLPPFLIGVVLISVFAAVLSSAGSQILVSASTVVRDIFEKSIRSDRSFTQEKLTFYSRIAIVVLVYIAILAGVFIETDFYGFVLFAWAGLGASIGPAFMLTFFWKGATSIGIRAGIITGALTVIIWKSIPYLSGSIYELAPGFVLATLAIWIGSKIDKRIMSGKLNRKALYEDIKKAGSWE
jgi:sodium/proline symporter